MQCDSRIKPLESGGPTSVKGINAAGVHAGLKSRGALDVALYVSETDCNVAAFYTTNKLVGAHIPVFRESLEKTGGKARVIFVNSKIANCSTGEAGKQDNREIAAAVAAKFGIEPEKVLFASTGVIGRRLDIDKITASITPLVSSLGYRGGNDAARAIMTTDTRPKQCAVEVTTSKGKFYVAGVAKGSGMICPTLATMFGFIFTDAAVSVDLLKKTGAACIQDTFNSISVDGDTSPNDTVLFLANGSTGVEILDGEDLELFEKALYYVAQWLAIELIRDGEGATKLVQIDITGAESDADARTIARTIAHSQLVKTAIFGKDPNWGRIISAAGRAGVPFDPEKAELTIDACAVYNRGRCIPPEHLDVMKESDVCIQLDLGLGSGSTKFWTCDLSYDYVKINAEYTT